MKEASKVVLLAVLMCCVPHAMGIRFRPPGKPAMTRCRSPEKETFTCWWEPGSDGGLPTTYALYYRKESSETVHECPDYRTAGENSCFFNKNDTSIWVNYNITVVATNALGSTYSDPVDIDVVYIVKPNPPEKVTVIVMEDKDWPFLRVSWEPPHKADTRSGWITLIYELRVRSEGEEDWEMHLAGQQKSFNVFSLRSGGVYQVQVRCKPDHGFWSEWSSGADVEVPDYFPRDKSVWVPVAVFAAFFFLIFTWLLHVNSPSLKHCILPPVPGPKIRGFDKQLLKNGTSGEIFSALIVSDFPPTTSSNCEDLLVDYLEVQVTEELVLMLDDSKELRDNCLKLESSTSDNDSGHGSCDSHTLLLCRGAKGQEGPSGQGRSPAAAPRHREDWTEDAATSSDKDAVSPDVSGGRVKTWPSVFSPPPQSGPSAAGQDGWLRAAKQHRLSDSLFPQSPCLTQPAHGAAEAQGASYWELCRSGGPPHALLPQLRARSDDDLSGAGRKRPPQRALHHPNEYVGVEGVNEEEAVLPKPVRCGDGCPQLPKGEEYSKVKCVNGVDMLLLQREATEEEEELGRCPRGNWETAESCVPPSPGNTTQKPAGPACAAPPTRDQAAQPVSDYVDTAVAFALPAH